MDIKNFDFSLPDSLIATSPIYPRDSSRMLVLQNNQIIDRNFSDIINIISDKDIIVFNNSKVIKAKIYGKINEKIFEINLHKMLDSNTWLAFAKKTKKINVGDVIEIAKDFSCEVLEKIFGEIKVRFLQNNVLSLLEQYGEIPIPPYFKRKADNNDSYDYQTIYAEHQGSVAAPTAGLHFTNDIMKKITEKKIKTAFVTLHVGAGTFMPVKTENIKDHKMHSELCYLSADNAKIINEVKKQGGRVFAVGTTTLRTLETIAAKYGDLQEFCDETNIFIYPGFEFKIVDNLITNFHLPRSTLLMLISAFSGINNIQKLYQHAIESKYRFYSYGDCCLLERNKNDKI